MQRALAYCQINHCSSDTAKTEAESKQKTYASHEDAKQAFKDLLREKVLISSLICIRLNVM